MVQNYEKAMEKLGDWLYIIFIGIAIVSSIISSLNKAKKQREISPADAQKPQPEPVTARQMQPESGTKPSWMEILQGLEEKVSEPKPAPKPSQPVSKVRMQPGAGAQPKSPSITPKNAPKERFQSRISRKIEVQGSVPETNLEYSSVEIDFDDISEIKKGIVYGEIINRKY